MTLRPLLATLAALALLGYAGVCLLLYLAQDRLLYYPVPTRAVALPTLVLERPGARVLASVRESASPEAVVYFGGNAEDVSQAVDTLAAGRPGAAVYVLHYRGYGDSGGRPRERDLVGDALALVARVRERHPEITVVGRSLGSGVAVQVAAQVPVRRVVLVTPYDSIAGLGAAQFPWAPVRWLMRDHYDSGRYAPRITAPVTVIAASDDTVVPPWSTARLLARFRPGIAHRVVIAGRDHVDLAADPAYLQALRAAR